MMIWRFKVYDMTSVLPKRSSSHVMCFPSSIFLFTSILFFYWSLLNIMLKMFRPVSNCIWEPRLALSIPPPKVWAPHFPRASLVPLSVPLRGAVWAAQASHGCAAEIYPRRDVRQVHSNNRKGRYLNDVCTWEWAPVLVAFVPVIAYYFGLSLPEKFTQPNSL